MINSSSYLGSVGGRGHRPVPGLVARPHDRPKAALDVRVELLAQEARRSAGPPWNASRVPDITNIKELRASEGGPLRVLFMFDPRRRAILLLGGDKSGRWREWYDWAVPAADDL